VAQIPASPGHTHEAHQPESAMPAVRRPALR
jgi:hypothetical protein